MIVDRRVFAKYAAAGTLIAATGAMEGCNFASDIIAWGPYGLAAFNGLVTVLETFGVLTADPALMLIVTAVRVGFADLVQDVQLYQSIKPPPSGALAEIEAVLFLIAGNISSLFEQVTTSFSPIVNLIIGFAQLILGVIEGFLNAIHAANPGSKVKMLSGAVNVAGHMIPYTPLTISREKFRSQWNKICVSQGHPEAGF